MGPGEPGCAGARVRHANEAKSATSDANAIFALRMAPPDIGERTRPGAARELARRSGVEHLAFVQKHERIVVLDLVHQMRRPERGDAALAAKGADMGEDRAAGRKIEADGRLVQKQELRLVEERAGDLGLAAQAVRQGADRIVEPVEQSEARKLDSTAFLGFGARKAVERRLVAHVLAHREVDIEGRQLEHHAQSGKRNDRPCAKRGAEHPDLTRPRVIKPSDQGHEGGLARAVAPKEDRKSAGCDLEADLAQHRARAEAMTHAIDLERLHGAVTTPQGERPTAIDLTGSRRSRSITVTSPEPPLAA